MAGSGNRASGSLRIDGGNLPGGDHRGRQTIGIHIENQIIKGIAETTKVDAGFPENKLSGAVFEIYADVDNNGEFDADIDQLVGEMTETEPGLYQMKDLVYGNYFLHEKESPEFFQRDENYYPSPSRKTGPLCGSKPKLAWASSTKRRPAL